MKKQELTNKIKNEGVKGMRREELETKLNEGQELTKEEANQLSFLLRKEEFLTESKKALTLDEVDLIKDITGVARITDDTVMELLLTLQENTSNGEVNSDYTEELSLVIAKVQNIFNLLRLIEVKADISKLSRKIDGLTNGIESLEDLPKDKLEEFKTTFEIFHNAENIEEFIINSYMPITDEELITMSNTLDKDVTRRTAKIHRERLDDIVLDKAVMDGYYKVEVEDYPKELDLIVAKLKNM